MERMARFSRILEAVGSLTIATSAEISASASRALASPCHLARRTRDNSSGLRVPLMVSPGLQRTPRLASL